MVQAYQSAEQAAIIRRTGAGHISQKSRDPHTTPKVKLAIRTVPKLGRDSVVSQRSKIARIQATNLRRPKRK